MHVLLKLPARGIGALTVVTAIAFPATLSGQIVQMGSPINVGEKFKDLPALPTPRLPDGRINLGAMPGQVGLWFPFNSVTERIVNPDDMPADDANRFQDRPKLSDIPFQPWTRELYNYRRGNQFEPHTRCKPSAGPRQFLTPYGVEFVDLPELQRIFIMDLGGPHTYRTIFMDGRPHPKNLVPTYYGHSIGKWEGDTLVVDTRGFNEDFWFDRLGLPHTERLHMIERFTRTDSKTMKYQVTIDDLGAYTAVWSGGFVLGWSPEEELFEYVCQDNNLATGLLMGSEKAVDRSSTIVP
jgi:hypothetical protein